MAELDDKLNDKTLETSVLLHKLGREALDRIAGLMRFSSNENIILRASQDLADRAPGTQKIQKHQVEAFTLSGRDSAAIAAAMVEAAKVRQGYAEVMQGNFIKVPLELPSGEGTDNG